MPFRYEWLRSDQIDDEYPEEVADALKKELRGKEGFYKPNPQVPWLESAAFYKVLIKSKETDENVDHHEKESSFVGDAADAPE
eukprot:12084918-Alexandrium_andersonii.AAC.1